MDFVVSVSSTIPLLLDGLLTTLVICIAGMAVAFAIAAPLVAARRSSVSLVRRLSIIWVAIVRGLPIVILVFLMYFGIPALLGLGRVSAWWVGVIALGINGGAFMSEVLRAAISSVPRGQWEACESLGLPRYVTWFRIILPQALRIALPALVGELTFLVKASPVLSLITVVDLTRRSQQVSMQTFDPLAPMLAAAVLYFAILYSLSLLSRAIETQVAIKGHRA